jgi:hypothetical protein
MSRFSELDIERQNADMKGSLTMETKLPARRDGLGSMVYSARAFWHTSGHRSGDPAMEMESIRIVNIEFDADGSVDIGVLNTARDWIGSVDLPAPFGEQLYALLFDD